jgi:Protein of unknown function (DUF3225)
MNTNLMQVNHPAVVAELQALYPHYESALVNNDAEALTAFFWNSPLARRFGITENLYGFAEIASFRKGRSPVNLGRTIRRLDIVTFGQDHGEITLEFERGVDGHPMRGRQSQSWIRFAEGWRIVSAHVSLLP